MQFHFQGKAFYFRQRPYDLSLPLRSGPKNPNAWWSPAPEFKPAESRGQAFAVEEGAAVNHYGVHFFPHGNGTHTECLGHLTDDPEDRISQRFHAFHTLAYLGTVAAQSGRPIKTQSLKRVAEKALANNPVQSLLVRSLPNAPSRRHHKYSGTNPPFFEPEIAHWLVEEGVEHFLTDLPSPDPESDGGALRFHRAFFALDEEPPRYRASITELIYAPEQVPDGLYLLNLVPAAFELDAAPSRVLLYPLDL